MIEFDKKRLFKSKLVMVMTAVFCIMLVLVIIKSIFSRPKSVAVPVKTTIAKRNLSTEELWRQKMNEELKSQKQALNQEIETLKQTVEKKNPVEQRIESLQSSIEQIKLELMALRDIKPEEPKVEAKGISHQVLNLDAPKKVKTADNYIPAGSLAGAVLVSGIDAATSLGASGDPSPVLIRITEHGTLPRRFKSDLKDCHMIGAAYGDLSSQRAKIRLEKLSCVQVANGHIIETEVAGYVTGEDGRQGVRGTVVSMDEKLLTNAFASGLLSGLSNNFNPSTAYQQTSLFGTSAAKSTKDRLQDSFASGATSSMDRLSKYYIDRAEALQPVVQVGAGRKVDVIFTEGVFFGSKVHKELKNKDSELIKKVE